MTEKKIAALRRQVIKYAETLLGRPYRYGARPEDAPYEFDCSSFTQYLYRLVGIEIPRSSILQAAKTTPVTERLDADGFRLLRLGDLLFMRGTKGHYDDALFGGREIAIGHVALYAGEGNAIHARSPEGVVWQSIAGIEARHGYRVILATRVLS